MKILFVVSAIEYSGAEIVLERYIKNNNEIEPYFLLLFNKPHVVKKFKERYSPENVFSLNIKHRINEIRFFPFKLMEKIKVNIKNITQDISADIIYVNNTLEGYLFKKAAQETDIITILHIHDMKSTINNPFRRYLSTRYLQLFDHIFTVSRATQQEWGEAMEVVYNGLPEKYFKKGKRKYEDIKNLGFVGTISKRKGVDILLHSLKKLLKIDSDFILHLVYSKVQNKRLLKSLKLLQEKYPGNIKIFRNLNKEEMEKFYSSIDLLLVPSRNDPLPTVIMEAMAKRIIVIGADNDGIPEMINNETLLFQNDSNSLIRKIIELKKFSDKKLNILSAELYKYAVENFSKIAKERTINNRFKNLIKQAGDV